MHGQYLKGANTFTWDQSRVLREVLRPGDKVIGALAPTLVVDSGAKALTVFNSYQNPAEFEVLSDAIVKQLGITHAIIVADDLEAYEKAMPQAMNKARCVRTMVLHPKEEAKEKRYFLFALSDPALSEKK